MKKIIYIALFAIIPALIGCNDYVTGVDKFIDKVQDDQLADRSQLTFLQNGLLNSFAQSYDQVTYLADGLSDQLEFDSRNVDATYTSFDEVETGTISTTNPSVLTVTLNIGEFRYFAQSFLEKVAQMQFTDNDPAEKEAYFYGNLMSGVSRYFYAAYIGLEKTNGGGPEINKGPFIPSADMYDQAVTFIKKAIEYGTPAQNKIANTLLAKIYINQNKYTEATQYANAGMTSGDDVFKALYTDAVTNAWASFAGSIRAQWTIPARIVNYVAVDEKEAARVKVKPYKTVSTGVIYRQDKHALEASPLTFLSWQENDLMLAEIALNGGDKATALQKVNAVRASYGISALTDITMATLLVEREKELFCQGARLIDQRRHTLFHLPNGWQFLPIQDRERNDNPNFN
ncbi:MAG: RagB/SusD family nutrient uptake outer membrane protein [Rhodothermaceae bacterium]